MSPLVSIVCVVFRAAPELPSLLESIVANRGEETELIVIDGGSKDGTLDVLRSFGNSIDYWLSEPDRGIYDAMNKGIAAATGDFVLHLNAGDRLRRIPHDALRRCLTDRVDVACFAVEMEGFGTHWPRPGNILLRFTNPWHHQGVFYRRTSHPGYDPQYRIYGDFDLNQKLLKAGKTVRCFETIVAEQETVGVSSSRSNFEEQYRLIRSNFGLPYVWLAFVWLRISRCIPPLKRLWESGQGESREEEGASARNRRAAATGGTAVVARAVQVGTSLITVPLTIHYLGNERFGLWMAISSVLAMANFADFGLGNGVLNRVAEAYGKEDIHAIRRAISSGFAVLSAVAVVLFSIFLFLYPLISWADAFRVSSPLARAEAAPALLVFAFCFSLNIPLDLVQRAQLGLQQGFRANLWQLCGSLAGLAGVIAGIRLQAGLPLLVAALAGAPVLATALNTLQFFAMGRPDLCPKLQFVSRDAIRQIAHLGGLFFLLQMVAAVSFSADNLIVARVLGAAAVPDYSIPQRMFSVISLVVFMLVTPLWPAYGEAISRGEMQWVRGTLGRSLWGVLAFAGFASATLLLLSRWIIHWWVGPQIHPPLLLLVGLALWTVTDSLANTVAMFLNGAGILRFQAVVFSCFGIACIAAKVHFTRRFGLIAVPWSTLLTYLPIMALPISIRVSRAVKRLHRAPAEVLVATPVEE